MGSPSYGALAAASGHLSIRVAPDPPESEACPLTRALTEARSHVVLG